MALYIQATKDGQDYILYPTENIPIRLDISTIESGEIGEVFSDLSQSFTFAATEEHNRFFSNAFTVGGQVVPGTSTKVPVTINSEKETLFAGSLLLNSWNESSKTYSCSLSSGIGDLSSELEDKVLADADWTALVHPYTMDQALAVNNQQTMPDYFYPLVDLGYDKGGRPFVPDDVELPGVSSTETYNPSPNQHNVDYYQETYNTYGFNYQTAQSNRLISPSIYFGAIAEGPVTQGYITHPMTPLRIDQLLPAISIKSVLDRIFEQANATYEAGFLNMLSDLYILPKATAGLGFSGDFTDDKGFISTSASSYRVPDVNVNNSADKSSGGRTIWTYGADSPTVTATFNEGSNFTASTGVYVAPETGTYSFTFKCQVGNQVGTIDNVFNNAYWNSRFAILVNGREIKAVDTPRIGNNGSFNGGDNYEVEIDSGDLLIYANQRVEAKWISGPSRSADNFSLEVIGPEFRTTKVPVNFNGLDINPGMQFGDTTSLDVLQALVRKLNLAIVPDKNVRGHYIIHQYYDWILSGNRVDWTERVSNIEHQPVLSDLEREIVFTDAEDDDRLNAFIQDSFQDTIYGQHKYVSSSDITEGSETIGDFFGPLINASVPDAGDITKSIVPDPQNGIPHLYEYDPADGATSMEPAIRIGYRKPIIINSNIYYANSSNSVVKYDLHRFLTLSNTNWNRTRDINFSNQYSYSNPSAEGAYDTYWKQYVDHLYQPGARKITCDVQFNPSDYTTLNIQDTVHIDGSDYLINKINGFNLSRPDVVEVELITYNNNFTNVFEEPVNRFIEDDSIARTHILGIQAIGYDGDPDTADVIPEAIQVSRDFYDYDGDPTTSETFTLRFATSDEYDLSASNFISNAGDLTGVTHTPFVDDGDSGNVTTEVTVTIGSDHQYSRLEFKTEIDSLAEGDQFVDLNTTSSVTGVSVQNGAIRQFGAVGTASTFRVFLSVPDSTMMLDTSTITTNVDSVDGLSLVAVTDFGTGAELVLSANIEDPIRTYDLEVTGGTLTAVPVGVDVVTHTVNFSEAANYVDVSIYPTQITYTGQVGETHDFTLQVAPASGYRTVASSWSITDIANVNDSAAVQDGYNVGIPVRLTTPATAISAQSAVVNGANGIKIGTDTFNNTITVTRTTSANYNLGGRPDSIVVTGVPDSTHDIQIDFDPAEGYEFTNVGQLVRSVGGTGLTHVSSAVIGNTIVANYRVTIGSSNQASSIAVTGSGPSLEANSLTFIVNNIGIDNAQINTGSFVVGYNTTQAGSGIPSTKFEVSPKSEMMFANASAISVSQNNSAEGISNDYDTTTSLLSSGNIEVSITGVYPSVGGHHVITIDVNGGSSISPATSAQWANNRYSTGLTSGSVIIGVTANGTWDITGNEAMGSYASGVSATASGTDSEMGSVTISWGSVTVARTFGVLITDSTGVNVLGTLLVTQEEAATSGLGGSVRRSYDLTASLIQPTVFLYQPQPGATQNATVPAGDSTTIFSYVTPTIVSGSGNGASVTGGELAESTTGDSGSVGGFTIVTQSSAPSGVPSTQITFVT